MIPTSLLLYEDTSVCTIYQKSYYIITICGILMHQTLDAVDGKHARKWGYSTGLGELMDHGIDSMCGQVYTIFFIHGFGLEDNFYSSIFVIGTWLTIWTVQNYCYHERFMVTSSGIIGVTEIQFLAILCLIIVFNFGHSIMRSPLRNLPITQTIYETIGPNENTENLVGCWLWNLQLNQLCVTI